MATNKRSSSLNEVVDKLKNKAVTATITGNLWYHLSTETLQKQSVRESRNNTIW